MPALMALGIVAAIFGAVYAVEVLLLRRRPADITNDMISGSLWPMDWLAGATRLMARIFRSRRG